MTRSRLKRASDEVREVLAVARQRERARRFEEMAAKLRKADKPVLARFYQDKAEKLWTFVEAFRS